MVRDSTENQSNIAWKAFQEFVSSKDPEELDTACLLSFCLWLNTERKFQTYAIFNYKSSVVYVLQKAFGLKPS